MRVIHVVATACRIAHMSDRRGACERVHDLLELVAMILMERLRDGADFLIRLKGLRPRRVIGGNAGGELSAMLQIQKHTRHESRDFSGTTRGTKGGCFAG